MCRRWYLARIWAWIVARALCIISSSRRAVRIDIAQDDVKPPKPRRRPPDSVKLLPRNRPSHLHTLMWSLVLSAHRFPPARPRNNDIVSRCLGICTHFDPIILLTRGVVTRGVTHRHAYTHSRMLLQW